jgi:hypothetical protein
MIRRTKKWLWVEL